MAQKLYINYAQHTIQTTRLYISLHFRRTGYRTNKYCDERLRIDNEPNDRPLAASPKMVRTKKGDPVAEARIQNEQQSFTHLKIIKSSDGDEMPPDGDNKKGLTPATSGEEVKQRRKSSRVYSQVYIK